MHSTQYRVSAKWSDQPGRWLTTDESKRAFIPIRWADRFHSTTIIVRSDRRNTLARAPFIGLSGNALYAHRRFLFVQHERAQAGATYGDLVIARHPDSLAIYLHSDLAVIESNYSLSGDRCLDFGDCGVDLIDLFRVCPSWSATRKGRYESCLRNWASNSRRPV